MSIILYLNIICLIYLKYIHAIYFIMFTFLESINNFHAIDGTTITLSTSLRNLAT